MVGYLSVAVLGYTPSKERSSESTSVDQASENALDAVLKEFVKYHGGRSWRQRRVSGYCHVGLHHASLGGVLMPFGPHFPQDEWCLDKIPGWNLVKHVVKDYGTTNKCKHGPRMNQSEATVRSQSNQYFV